MDNLNRELDSMLAAYKQAVPDPEPSPEFMPRLWRKIDARRNLVFRLGRLTRVFLTSAAALCLLMTGVQTFPRSDRAAHPSYLDILAESHNSDNLFEYLESMHEPDLEGTPR
jgi:hypothetical protein